MDTLLEVLDRLEQLGWREAVRWSNGLRTWTWGYSDLYARIASFAGWLEAQGIIKGDRIMIWGENPLEWLVVFWASGARGVEVVRVDFRFSLDLLHSIQTESRPKPLVHGSSLDAGAVVSARIGYDAIIGVAAYSPALTDLLAGST